MFYSLSNIVEIDFTGFDCSSVSRVKCLFEDCINLKKITFNSNFGEINSLYRTFSNCNSLTSIDLSVFDTSQVSEMQYLFNNCNSLLYLNISNFITSEVYSMEYMFYSCTSLRSIIFPSNIDTQKFKYKKF